MLCGPAFKSSTSSPRASPSMLFIVCVMAASVDLGRLAALLPVVLPACEAEHVDMTAGAGGGNGKEGRALGLEMALLHNI